MDLYGCAPCNMGLAQIGIDRLTLVPWWGQLTADSYAGTLLAGIKVAVGFYIHSLYFVTTVILGKTVATQKPRVKGSL